MKKARGLPVWEVAGLVYPITLDSNENDPPFKPPHGLNGGPCFQVTHSSANRITQRRYGCQQDFLKNPFFPMPHLGIDGIKCFGYAYGYANAHPYSLGKTTPILLDMWGNQRSTNP